MAWSYEPKNTWFFGKTLAKLGQEGLKHQFEGQETFLVHQSVFQQWRNLPNNAFGQVWPRKCREDAKFPISKIFLPACLMTWTIFFKTSQKSFFCSKNAKCSLNLTRFCVSKAENSDDQQRKNYEFSSFQVAKMSVTNPKIIVT